MKRERATLLSDLKVARLQLRRPADKGEDATMLDQMGREVAAARRDLEEAKREAKKAKAAGEAEAVKAARAREEVTKLKEAEKRAAEEIKVNGR